MRREILKPVLFMMVAVMTTPEQADHENRYMKATRKIITTKLKYGSVLLPVFILKMK